MEEDLDFSSDLIDDSLDNFSVDESVELLDFENNDISDYDSLVYDEDETIDIDDFNDDNISLYNQNDEQEINVLDFDNSDELSNCSTDELADAESQSSDNDINEALIDNSVSDVPLVENNYEDADEISLDDLGNPNEVAEKPSFDDIIDATDFNEATDGNTYADADIDAEDGYAKVLKRNPDELIGVGKDLVNQRLEILEDQYRDDGLNEEEIQNRLADDKLEIQREFLNDAFPDQNVSPDVFNRFDSQSDLAPNENTDISNIDDMDNWLGDINPNFDEFDTDSPYSNNCGSCAYAVWKRLEGDNDICASAENIGYNDEMEALTGMQQVSMSPEDIESNLLAQGDGAHAIIGIDRAEGPGHWFNAACIDGKVVAIDGQSGEILDWPPDYGDVVNWEMSVKKG